MGDIALKRELQILLDKFKVLHDTDEMYTEKVPLNDDEVMFYTQKAKLILSLLVRKLGSIYLLLHSTSCKQYPLLMLSVNKVLHVIDLKVYIYK